MSKKFKVLVCLLIVASASCAILYGFKRSPTPVYDVAVGIVVDVDCPQAVVDLRIVKYQTIRTHFGSTYLPVEDIYQTGSSIKNVDLGYYVSGYEINYGFWSKNSYRKYSVKDYLREVRKINNPTQSDINSVSALELEDWFIRKHTSGVFFGTYPPEGVVVQREYKRYGPSVVFRRGFVYDITGVIRFPNGVVCKLNEIRKMDVASSNYQQIHLRVVSPCAGCSGGAGV